MKSTKKPKFIDWLLILSLIASLVFSVYQLQQNNLTAVRFRQELETADQTQTEVNSVLNRLRNHIAQHMNSNLASGENAIKPPIQLKYTYKKLVENEKSRVSKINAEVYDQAVKLCEEQFPIGLSGSGRIPCVQTYIESNSVKAQPIPEDLYKFDFVSPLWSPDIAGWSLVVSGAIGFIIVWRIILRRIAAGEES